MDRASTRDDGAPKRGGVAFTGGGTAGHVFPGLAVAEELSRLWEGPVFWIGTHGGVERALVEEAGIAFYSIPAGKLRRYLSLRNLTDVLRIAAGVFCAARVLARRRPGLLFSKGGFVSVPPVIAASLLGIPCYTHESDFDPGLATRINLRFCEKVFLSFPETLAFIPPAYRAKAVVTGNPVRAAVLRGSAAEGRRIVGCPADRRLLLVLGGSLGSAAVNSLVAECLPRLAETAFVVHQMGRAEYVPSHRSGYYTAPFFRDELPHVLAAADLVVTRSGAGSLAELAALGKPAILIPLPGGGTSRGDQLRNAGLYSSRGAAVVMGQEEAGGGRLAALVAELLGDQARLEDMRGRARALAGGAPGADIARAVAARVGQRA
jgi:UDP-N-acetylglucosamine--N-acetylmuramyl-(pentapeptide) pyrophosphoryl-undecaprenol N-acetylglucosamine transferase